MCGDFFADENADNGLTCLKNILCLMSSSKSKNQFMLEVPWGAGRSGLNTRPNF